MGCIRIPPIPSFGSASGLRHVDVAARPQSWPIIVSWLKKMPEPIIFSTAAGLKYCRQLAGLADKFPFQQRFFKISL